MSDQNDRPKVGPADPETRRKLLREKLNEPTGATGTVKRDEPAKPKKTVKRRYGPQGKTEDEITTAAERGETMSDAIERGIRESKGSKED